MAASADARCRLSVVIGFLLDEHYPGWLAEDLVADGVDAVALTAHRPGLRGVDDGRVLAVRHCVEVA